MEYVITYDIGTTGLKTCLYSLGKTVTLAAQASAGYDLFIGPGGVAEQDPDQWWQSMCRTTATVLSHSGIKKDQVRGISFCSQMQGLVLVDRSGRHLRPAMSYMDQRAVLQKQRGLETGIKIEGMNLFKLVPWLIIAGAVGASTKDPIWKYHWVRENEPAVFNKIYKWLDVKEYLISRCTGNFIMTQDSAFATFLYDSRRGKYRWSERLCRMLDVDSSHMPQVIRSTESAGGLTAAAAGELGLETGTTVFGGGGDASLIGVGAGASEKGDTHIYMGTSGWVSTVVDKRIVDTKHMIASVTGAETGLYNYFAEQETSGKCLEWVKDHMALDEIGIYLEKKHVTDDPETVYMSLYDFLCDSVKETPPGSNGVIFTPWLHGNRCPFEDHDARGMFFNIGLSTGKRAMIRSVLEGVCFHKRLMLDAQEAKIRTSETIRFAGGGALAPMTCQMLADITGRNIESIENPQNAGAAGAAMICAAGLGIIPSVREAKKLVSAVKTYTPDGKNHDAYMKNYSVFRELYRANRRFFKALNA